MVMIVLIRKHTDVFLVIGILLVLIFPWLITRPFGIIDFTETGEIGSTIGGITAPITGIIGAVLIYLALVEQRKANTIQSENNTIQSLLTLLIDLERKCENLSFIPKSDDKRYGIAAFNSISSVFYYDEIVPYIGTQQKGKYHEDLMVVINFGNY